MYNNRQLWALRAIVAGLLLVVCTAVLHAVEVRDLRWEGGDLVIRFSGDVTSTTDLAATDSGEVVIRVKGTGIGSTPPATDRRKGRDGIEALLTPSGANELRLTLHGNGKLGYAMLWRPYSHTLIVHTFRWDKIDYAQTQYYKGLMALEQGLNDAGAELLEIARSTGDARAASVLGVMYARAGNFKRAAGYLNAPGDADDYAALAEVERRTGDMEKAGEHQRKFEEMAAAAAPARTRTMEGRREGGANARGDGDSVAQGGPSGDAPIYDSDFEDNETIRARNGRRWMYIAGGILGLLLVIWVVTRMSRRGGGNSHEGIDLDRMAATGPMGDDPLTTAMVSHASSARQQAQGQSAYNVPEPEEVPEATVVEDVRPAAEPAHVTSAHEEYEPRPITEHSAMDAHAMEPHDTALKEAGDNTAAEAEADTVPEAVVVEPVQESSEANHTRAASVETADARSVAADEPENESRSMPTQAADLRRKIEAMRSATDAPAVDAQPGTREQKPMDIGSGNESTIAAARRLQLSRDSVELRRRMEQARGGQQ